MTNASDEVLAERQRQITNEGYTSAHDDDHEPDELVRAGIAYALTSLAHPDKDGTVSVGMIHRGVRSNWLESANSIWPWDQGPKPQTMRRDLVRAAALLLAALDRIDREKGKK